MEKLRTISTVDYITDGTPAGTIVVLTLDNGIQIDVSNSVTELVQDEDMPIAHVSIIGYSPQRRAPVAVKV